MHACAHLLHTTISYLTMPRYRLPVDAVALPFAAVAVESAAVALVALARLVLRRLVHPGQT